MDWALLTKKKGKLDKYRPMPPELVKNLEEWFLIELTYTSNAIEGNTLTRKETAAVVEKGITVGGKSLTEHLEATNHAKAINNVMMLAQSKTTDLIENDVLTIHNTILKGIDDNNAGHYRSIPVRISGSNVILPNPLKVSDLMSVFMDWLTKHHDKDMHPVQLAAEAHYQLVTIHPFVDGNGRTARLLMNLILLQHGYTPALIRIRDRHKYISALEKAQLGGSNKNYYKVIFDAVNRSLDIYLDAVTGKDITPQAEQKPNQLLRIGQLAKETGESTATIRYWTKQGLLLISDITDSGYQLYSPRIVNRIAKIRELQSQRYTLSEIKGKLK